MYDNFIPQHGILRLVTRVGGFTFIGSTGTLLTGTVWATALISILHFRWNKLYLLIPVMRHYDGRHETNIKPFLMENQAIIPFDRCWR